MQCKTCGKANCYAHGGRVKEDKMNMYEMEPDVPAMHAEGGEVADHEVDDELMDMACEELLHAIETKDKKSILESIKAIVLSCGE